MARVAVIKCETYDEEAVHQAVQKGMDLLGGARRFVKKGERILLKPNLLVPEIPKKCVTTHPAVFKAIAKILQKTGVTLMYGDSPAMGNMKRAAKKSGLAAVAEELNILPADFKTGKEVFFKDGIQNKKFIIAQGVLENDGLISLPKLKTHALERYTGCVKNQFGCVPGMLKGEYHVKISDAYEFGKMLVDLNNYIKPRLYIMDGIQAMEGNGPRGGTPKKMNVILISNDPIALDATVCRIINIKPEYVPTIKFGMASGMGTYLENEINLLGDSIDEFTDTTFKIKRKPIRSFKKQAKGVSGFINDRLVPKPVVVAEKCNACGTCVSVCPANPKAIDLFDEDKEKTPTYNYKDCIRCYCCQELCPEGAIELKTPMVRKLLKTIS